MADSSGGPEKGTPEYDWLYGTSTSGDAGRAAGPGPSSADEESTQVFRSSGRPDPQGGDDRTQTFPAAGPAAGAPYGAPSYRPAQEPPPRRPVPPPQQPGPPPGRSRRGSGGRRFPRPRPRWILALLVLWLVFLVVTPIVAYIRIDRVDAFPDDDNRPDNQPGTTYLIVGSDSREDLSAEEREELGTGDAAGRRTDTILLLRVGSGPDVLMSVPRDLQVEIPGRGSDRINAAYAYGGPRLLTRTVEATTGVRVDHYVEIGFGGFVGVVDGVGGIEICPEQAMDDPLANLRVRRGCQEVDGETALGYARSRNFPNGDIQRAENQREVVSAVGDKALSPWSVLNPLRWWRLNMSAAASLDVSEGTGPFALGRFAFAMTNVGGDDSLTCSYPIAGITNPLPPDTARADELFGRIIDNETERIGRQLCTPTGLP